MILRFLRFLLLVGVCYALYKWLWKGVTSLQKEKKKRAEAPPNTSTTPPKIIAEMKKDPVCGTYIPENQAFIHEIHGTAYYFCSEECKSKFQELPG